MTKTEELAKCLVENENFASNEQAVAFLEEVKDEVLSLIVNELYYKISLLEDFAEKLEKSSTDDFLARVFTTDLDGIFFDTDDINTAKDWDGDSDEDAKHIEYITYWEDAVKIQLNNYNIEDTFMKYLKTLMHD